jgi:hypothetical protein
MYLRADWYRRKSLYSGGLQFANLPGKMAILTQDFCGFSQYLQENAGMSRLANERFLLDFFPIHSSSIIIPFCVT